MKESIIRDPIALRVVACGPVVSILQSQPITIGENGSNMIIEYRLNANQDSLSVKCKVDWKESHKTLRYQIPTLYCGDVSRFGAPFNFVDRSQIPQGHKEEAQWEVPGSRWASVLNGSMTDGLSIVTQAKYGFRAKQGTLGLTLLRSPTQPDPMADKGVHNIQFAITRHHNTFSSSDLTKHLPTAAKADDIFTPLVILSEPSCRSIINPPIKFKCLGSAVPSWVLPSNKSLGFCIRLHENAGDFTKISFSIPQKSCVQTVNFNEKVLSLLEPTSSDDDCYCYDLFIPAYKIVTLQILI